MGGLGEHGLGFMFFASLEGARLLRRLFVPDGVALQPIAESVAKFRRPGRPPAQLQRFHGDLHLF
eukprot:2018521-Rhodomonas_salina.1